MARTKGKNTAEESVPSETSTRSFKNQSFFSYYLNNSTIHGTKYVAEADNWFKKGFWVVALFISMVLCGYVLYTTYVKWQFQPDIGFTKKIKTVQSIPFPTLTICPQTKAQKSLFSFEHCYRRRFEKTEQHGSSFIESAYFESLLHACDPQLLKFLNLNESVLGENFEIVPILQKLLYTVDDTMMFCKWRDNLVNCSKFFNQILTDQGICFSFNMLDYKSLFHDGVLHKDFDAFNHSKSSSNWTLDGGYSTDYLDSYPWSIISHQYDGLRLILKISDVDMDSVCRGSNQGFRVYWNMPNELPNALSRFLFIPIEQDVTISMTPSKTETAENLLKYNALLRQCYLSKERSLIYFKVYTKSNCELECLANFTLSTCKCVKFSMPRDSDISVCNATKLKCVLDAEREWLSFGTKELAEAQCGCLPACTEISYDAQLRQTNFDYARMFKSYDYDLTDMPGIVMSRLTIYFENSDFETTERYAVFDSMDFLASCGGLLGLFMGFSILSLIEISYYFILWIAMFKKQKMVEPVVTFVVTEASAKSRH